MKRLNTREEKKGCMFCQGNAAGEYTQRKFSNCRCVCLGAHQRDRVHLPLHHYVITRRGLSNVNTCTHTSCMWCKCVLKEFSVIDAPGQTQLYFTSIGSCWLWALKSAADWMLIRLCGSNPSGLCFGALYACAELFLSLRITTSTPFHYVIFTLLNNGQKYDIKRRGKGYGWIFLS